MTSWIHTGRFCSKSLGQHYRIVDLDFADDIALLTIRMNDAEKLLSAVEHWSLSIGFKINENKISYMHIGDFNNCNHPHSLSWLEK